MANIYVSSGTSFSATISITYPSGSTCTVSNYKKTWTAPNTSGSWTFKANEVGYYTVKAVSGDKTTTTQVAVTTNGQTQTVKLVFWDGTIYNKGDECTDHTGGWTLYAGTGYDTATKTNNQLYIKVQESDSKPYIRTTNKVSLTGFTKIQATVSAQTHSSSWGGNERCKLLVSANTDLSNPVASVQPTNSDAQTLSLAISLTGTYYVGIKAAAGTASTVSMTVTKIQLV